MNRINEQTIALRARAKAKSLRARAKAKSLRARAGAVATAMLGSLYTAAAWAQATDVGAAITSEVTNAKDKVSGILVILAAIVGVLLLWAYVKKAR